MTQLTLAASRTSARPASVHGLVGHRIDNYTVLRLLGEGGMGTVYEARHQFLDRRAAIKVLRPGLAEDKGAVSRFFNEARATHAVGHTGVVEVHDLGILPDGLPYMVMELLTGESLASRRARLGTLPVNDVIDIGLQTAGALGAAHAVRIVHRDLKPDNILLVPDRGGRGGTVVKIIDFGVAQVRGPARFRVVDTLPGALVGTPAYMSPEQCRGLDGAIDHRADIYALGIILYELLCGAPPFVSRGCGEMLAMHLMVAPAPPSRWRADLPAPLEAIVLQALEKEPGRRFASMGELATALAAVDRRRRTLTSS